MTRKFLFCFSLFLVLLLLQTQACWARKKNTACPASTDPMRHKVVGIKFIGQVAFPTGYQFEQTEVGGLSAITYDAEGNQFHVLSDDRSEIDPARFYTLEIDLKDGRLNSGDLRFKAVTTLTDADGSPFLKGSVDPEGITISPRGQIYISSEGDATALIPPFIGCFSSDGRLTDELTLPKYYLPEAVSGIRNNLALESLTLAPDHHFLYTAVENALLQDGPSADIGQASPARILKYDLERDRLAAEMVYWVDPVPETPQPANAFRINGLVELIALDNKGTLLSLERAFSTGRGNTVKLHQLLTQGALNLSGRQSLFRPEEGIPFVAEPPVQKEELLDFSQVIPTVDNLEGMALGPRLPDGRRALIVVSDNNFNKNQTTQFIALALTLEKVPTARPKVETPQALD